MPRRPARSKRPKTPELTPESVTSTGLVPQPHGGAIYQGAPAHPVAGPGRPRSVIRARMRRHLDEELIEATLADWRDNKLTSLEVAEFFAKYGLGTQSQALSPEQVEADVQAITAKFVEIAVTRWGRTMAEATAAAQEMAQAARGDD